MQIGHDCVLLFGTSSGVSARSARLTAASIASAGDRETVSTTMATIDGKSLGQGRSRDVHYYFFSPASEGVEGLESADDAQNGGAQGLTIGSSLSIWLATREISGVRCQIFGTRILPIYAGTGVLALARPSPAASSAIRVFYRWPLRFSMRCSAHGE